MKTNTLKFLPLIAAFGLTLLAATLIAASNLTVMSVGVSYLAVAILFALAVLDYRVGHRSYSAR